MDHGRRRITKGLAAASLVSTVPFAFAQGQIKLTLAHNLTPTSPKGVGAATFADLLSAKTNGRITVHVAHSEQLGNENTNMSALRTGTLDLGALGQGAMLSVAPEVAAIGLPFLFSTLPQAWAVLDGPVGQDLAKRLESKNLVFLGWWCNGIRQTTNSKRPITKPEDFKGLRIRTPLDPATVDMFAAMGATPSRSTGAKFIWPSRAAWWTDRRTRSPTSTRRSCTKCRNTSASPITSTKRRRFS